MTEVTCEWCGTTVEFIDLGMYRATLSVGTADEVTTYWCSSECLWHSHPQRYFHERHELRRKGPSAA